MTAPYFDVLVGLDEDDLLLLVLEQLVDPASRSSPSCTGFALR